MEWYAINLSKIDMLIEISELFLNSAWIGKYRKLHTEAGSARFSASDR